MIQVFQGVLKKKKALAIAAVGLIAVAGGSAFFLKGKPKDGSEHHAEAEKPASGEHHANEQHPASEPHVTAEHGTAEHGTAEHGNQDEHQASQEEKHSTTDSHATEQAHAPKAASAHAWSGFFGRFGQAFEDVQSKIDEIRRVDLENQRLRLENAQLRLRVESGEFECSVAKSKQLTEEYAALMQKNAGNRTGRTLASITYQPPTHLLPAQLHALGLSQFRAGEFEKSAKIFTLLAEMSKEDSFQTPAHKVLTAVSWYRLKNWDMAENYLDQVLRVASEISGEPEDSQLKVFAQARLWKALLAHQRGKKAEAQAWMQQLVEHHPRSPEANWINTTHEAGGHRVRVPASHH